MSRYCLVMLLDLLRVFAMWLPFFRSVFLHGHSREISFKTLSVFIISGPRSTSSPTSPVLLTSQLPCSNFSICEQRTSFFIGHFLNIGKRSAPLLGYYSRPSDRLFQVVTIRPLPPFGCSPPFMSFCIGGLLFWSSRSSATETPSPDPFPLSSVVLTKSRIGETIKIIDMVKINDTRV